MPRGTGKAQTDGKDETGMKFSLGGCPEGGNHGGLELSAFESVMGEHPFPCWTDSTRQSFRRSCRQRKAKARTALSKLQSPPSDGGAGRGEEACPLREASPHPSPLPVRRGEGETAWSCVPTSNFVMQSPVLTPPLTSATASPIPGSGLHRPRPRRCICRNG